MVVAVEVEGGGRVGGGGAAGSGGVAVDVGVAGRIGGGVVAGGGGVAVDFSCNTLAHSASHWLHQGCVYKKAFMSFFLTHMTSAWIRLTRCL